MIKRIAPLLVFLLLLLPVVSFSDSSDNAPLTLLNEPQVGSTTGPNNNIANISEQLRDIRGPVPFSEPLPYLLIIGSVLLLTLLAAAIYYYLKKRTRPAPPSVPPWEKALMDLAEAKKLLTAERGLSYMDRASQILRCYIEARFSIQSTRQTTTEFLRGLKGAGPDSPLQTYKDELQACLELADMAKFAHHIPKLENLQLMEDSVVTFVKRTEPVPHPDPKGGQP